MSVLTASPRLWTGPAQTAVPRILALAHCTKNVVPDLYRHSTLLDVADGPILAEMYVGAFKRQSRIWTEWHGERYSPIGLDIHRRHAAMFNDTGVVGIRKILL